MQALFNQQRGVTALNRRPHHRAFDLDQVSAKVLLPIDSCVRHVWEGRLELFLPLGLYVGEPVFLLFVHRDRRPRHVQLSHRGDRQIFFIEDIVVAGQNGDRPVI